MTIEVEIRNKDAARQIEVVQVEYDKRTRTETRGAPYVIHPGMNWIGHVHALRDLVITEVNPAQQERPK